MCKGNDCTVDKPGGPVGVRGLARLVQGFKVRSRIHGFISVSVLGSRVQGFRLDPQVLWLGLEGYCYGSGFSI